MFNRDKVQFQDLWSERIFLGQATKLYNLKSQSSEVVSVFCFCLFQWMSFYLGWIISKVHHGNSIFDIEAESCLTVASCDFRTFGAKESLWAKQQSCITLKVSPRKRCPFFVFGCFSGCHFTQDRFTKKDNVQKFFFEFLHGFLTFLHKISKNQKHLLQMASKIDVEQCGTGFSCNQN